LLEDKKIVTEIKSFNHRYRDISLKLPRRFSPLENQIKRVISEQIARGKIDVAVQVEAPDQDSFNFKINLPLAKDLYEILSALKKEMKISEKISLSTLLSFKDIIMVEKEEDEANRDWDALRSSLDLALQAIIQMQEMEGSEISKDLLERNTNIQRTIQEIESLFPESLMRRQQTLRDRVKNLCEGIELDESRMLQEIALIADKSDITEELVRAKSHLKQFAHWLASSEPVGRKLDFLLQELNREINTVGSKASDAEISLKIVFIKNELEKMREQVQNLI
jgi:uncharacterized protein (TIGR00255 family)